MATQPKLSATQEYAARNETGRFYYQYALSYAMRFLRSEGAARATADPVHGQDFKARADEPKSRNAKRITADGMSLDHPAYDLVQDGFLAWHRARRGGRVPLSTRGAMRHAVQSYRRAKGKASRAERMYGEKRRAAVSSAIGGAVHSTLDSIPDMPMSTIAADMEGADTRLNIIVRMLASGSTQTDVAECLGITRARLCQLVKALREVIDPTDILPTVGNLDTRPERIYGEGIGTKTANRPAMLPLPSYGAADYIPAPLSTRRPDTAPSMTEDIDRIWSQRIATEDMTAELVSSALDCTGYPVE